MYVLCYFFTHRVKNVCVLRTPGCEVLYVISEILCVKYALLCVFGNTVNYQKIYTNINHSGNENSNCSLNIIS